MHDSVWCQFHSKINDDGSRYTTKSPLLCPVQSEAFEELLKAMADKPQEYITSTGKVTTNAIEGFHGLAFKYRGKRVDPLLQRACELLPNCLCCVLIYIYIYIYMLYENFY